VKIGIYTESGGKGGAAIGGTQNVVASLAEALSTRHSVELVHHVPTFSAEALAESSATNLANVQFRFVEQDPDPIPYFRNPFQRYAAARSWHAAVSAPYDLFIAARHSLPPFCHARRGAMIILFPADTARHLMPLPPELLRKSRFRQNAERRYQSYEWRKRLEGYQVVTSISDYTRLWTQRRWGTDSETVYPPVDNDFGRVPKENIILSVGRFALPDEGHGKKQEEMLSAYGQAEEELPGWEYFTVGGLPDTPNHHAFFGALCRQAALCRSAGVDANLGRDALKGLYERASIFWHAAGYGADDDDPLLVEHFGISTVEAMAAGCVPVVINKGGPREVVEHGVNGFLWNTIEELRSYTVLLARDEQLRERMSEAARDRAKFFSRERFFTRFLRLLQPLLDEQHA
jgi:glycosyltransferase involved in cell wall biosynthesis